MSRREAIWVYIMAFLLTSTIMSPGWIKAERGLEPDEVTIDQLTDLYEPVVFQHQLHTEIYECSSCHHDSEGTEQTGRCGRCHGEQPFEGQAPCSSCHSSQIDEATKQEVKDGTGEKDQPYHIDTPALKGTWHILCRSCHLVDGGPTGCQDCHAYTENGRNFFHEDRK